MLVNGTMGMGLWGGLTLGSWMPWKNGIEKNVQNQNETMNMASYYKELYQLVNIAISTFEWKNLPEGVDERQMELWLLCNGYVIFFYDESLMYDEKQRAPEGFAVLQGTMHGDFDLYNIPTDRRVYAPNGFNKELTDENSVIIFNNRLRTPEIFVYMLYAQRIAEIDRTIDVNVMNQKSPKIIRCDDKQRLTFKNLAMQIIGNVYTVMADKNVDLKDVEVLDTTVPFVGEDLDRLKRRYKSEAMTYMGIEGVDTDKKERLIGAEVLRGMGDVEAMRFTRLTERQRACKQINELFDLDVSVDFRSGLYIQTGETQGMLDTTSGMQSGGIVDPTVNNTGYSNE